MATFCALLAATGYAIFLCALLACPVIDYITLELTYILSYVFSLGEQRQRLWRTISSDHRHFCHRSLPRHMAREQHTTTLSPCDGGRGRRGYGQRRRHLIHLALH
jgi:hypothetical protein